MEACLNWLLRIILLISFEGTIAQKIINDEEPWDQGKPGKKSIDYAVGDSTKNNGPCFGQKIILGQFPVSRNPVQQILYLKRVQIRLSACD